MTIPAIALIAVFFLAACVACVLIGRAFRLPFDIAVPVYPETGECPVEDDADREER